MDALNSIPVAVAGATGRMGQEIVRTIMEQVDMEFVAALGHARHLGEDIGELVAGEPCGIMVSADCDEVMEVARGGVCVVVTTGEAVKDIVNSAAQHNVACVIGATGITKADEEQIAAIAKASHIPVLIAPNFALGACLMMKFAQLASRYFRWAEIIEKHHERKLDAPSGTAMHTAEIMIKARGEAFRSPAEGDESLKGSRGGKIGGIRIHSVRMPGYLACQEVLFGSAGENLSIHHDASGRECFMSGVVLAVQKVRDLDGLTVGLENIIA